MKIVTVIIALNMALVLGFLAGYLWQQQELDRLRRDGERAPRPTATTGADRVAQARGVIRDVDRDRHAVLITHEALEGIMGAMTMRYPSADPRLLDGLTTGDRVHFTVQEIDKELRLIELRKSGES